MRMDVLDQIILLCPLPVLRSSPGVYRNLRLLELNGQRQAFKSSGPVQTLITQVAECHNYPRGFHGEGTPTTFPR